MDTIGFWGSLKVGQKIGLISALFLAALFGLVAYTARELAGRKEVALVMDIVGRQKTLVSLYARDVILEAHGLESETKLWEKAFEESLNALLEGGMATLTINQEAKALLPAAPTQEVRERLLEQKRGFAEYSAQAARILKLPRGGPAQAAAIKEFADSGLRLHYITDDAIKAYTAHFEAGLHRMIRHQVLIGLGVGLLGFLLSWAIARGIVGPLSEVVSKAQAIAQGDLRQDKLPVSSSDEIGRLASAFNAMQESLKEIARQTHEGTLSLNSASQEILASTQQQAASAKEQAGAVHETTSTVEEVRQAGTQIAERAKTVAQAAEGTSSAGRAGLSAVSETARAMDNIREQVEAVAENVVALSEKTQAVGEIIASVNNIAEQSHLLALNASIEAASAGEAGRSFSVVSAEIKNLADQAKQATVSVRGLLGEIQKGITASVMLTEEAVKRVESGKRQTELTEKAIRQFADTTTEGVQAFQQIVAATGQQQIGYDQVTSALQDIRKASEQTAVGTGQLEKAVSNLTALGQQLRKSVERYRV